MTEANYTIIKFLKRVFTFLLFYFFLYLVYLIIWGSFFPRAITKNLQFGIGAYGHMYSRLREADTIKNPDILFIGSSHSYRGYDPRIFKKYGLRIFNLGSSSQPPKVSGLLLEEYLPEIKPKLLIFDVFPNIFTVDGIESELDYISNSKPDMKKMELAIGSKNIKVINTYLYSIFYTTVGLFDVYHEGRIKKSNTFNPKEYDTYFSGGYVKTSLVSFDTISANYEYKKVIPTEENILAFKKMIEYLNTNNIKYILVQAPVTKEFYKSFINNKELNNEFSKYGTYYDFNEILNLSDKYFYDSNHLNQEGIELYNKELIKVLEKDSTFISAIK